MRALLLPAANQFHLGHNFFNPQNLMVCGCVRALARVFSSVSLIVSIELSFYIKYLWFLFCILAIRFWVLDILGLNWKLYLIIINHLSIQEEIRNAPSTNMMMNQLPNPNDLMMNTMMRGGHHEEIPKPPPANRRKNSFFFFNCWIICSQHDLFSKYNNRMSFFHFFFMYVMSFFFHSFLLSQWKKRYEK